jgi:hypothetical protein
MLFHSYLAAWGSDYGLADCARLAAIAAQEGGRSGMTRQSYHRAYHVPNTMITVCVR